MKRFLVIILAGLMLFSFAACGNNETPSGGKETDPISQGDLGALLLERKIIKFSRYDSKYDTSDGTKTGKKIGAYSTPICAPFFMIKKMTFFFVMTRGKSPLHPK